MSQLPTRRSADEPPVQPERVMPLVAVVLGILVVGLIGVGLLTLWPVIAGTMPVSATGLVASTLLFGALLLVVAAATRRFTPQRTR
jgi:sterol desaturase/sphingolipid hydroxylase (fatty acid hydroxylase superfamily)